MFESMMRNAGAVTASQTVVSAVQQEIARRREEAARRARNRNATATIDDAEAKEISEDHLAFETALDRKSVSTQRVMNEDALIKLFDQGKYEELCAVTARMIAERRWETAVTSEGHDKQNPIMLDQFSQSLRNIAYLLRAASLERLNRYDEAVQTCDEFIDLVGAHSSSSNHIRAIRATALAKRGDYEAALRDADALIGVDPLSLTPQQRAMQELLKDDAEADSDDAEPKACDKEPYLLKAEILLQYGKYAECISVSQQALSARARGPGVERSHNARAHHLMATASAELGQFMDAIKYANKAIELNPKDYTKDGTVIKARAFVALGENALALKALDSALRSEGRPVNLLISKALLLVSLEQHAEALALFDEIIEIESRSDSPKPASVPHNGKMSLLGLALSHKSRTLVRLNRMEEAERAISHATREAPQDPMVLLDAARLKIMTKKPAQALPLIDAALASFEYMKSKAPAMLTVGAKSQVSNDALAELLVTRATVLSQLNQVEEGLTTAKRAYELSPYSSACLILARLYEKNMQWTDALVYYDKATTVCQGNDLITAFLAKASIHHRMGDEAKAQMAVMTASALHPELSKQIKEVIHLPSVNTGSGNSNKNGPTSGSDFTQV